MRIELQPLQMGGDPFEKDWAADLHVAKGEIGEGMTDSAHRIEHIHRALHDVGQMPPAQRQALFRLHRIDILGAAVEMECHFPRHDPQRRPDRAGNGLDQRRLAAARFTGNAIDLAAGDGQADIVDGAHLAIDAEEEGTVIGFQILNFDQRIHTNFPSGSAGCADHCIRSSTWTAGRAPGRGRR